MNILITGGCGFVGTNLVARLTEMGGRRIRVLDNERLGKREHLGKFDGEFILGDIRDRATVDRALEGMDAVVHLAADTRVMDSIEDPNFNFDNNVLGTMNILEGMRTKGVKRLVNASTGGAIIGEVEPPVHEEMPPNPLSPYGASKLAVEGYCSAYAASYGLDIASLRFSNLYGPRSFHKGSVVAAFFKRILKDEPLTVYGDGSQIRDFVYVGDVCDGIVRAIDGGARGVFQLGSGIPVSISELIEKMQSVVSPRHVVVNFEAFRAGEVLATYCDVSKARRSLGYEPSTDLVSGLETTWRWFGEQAAAKKAAEVAAE